MRDGKKIHRSGSVPGWVVALAIVGCVAAGVSVAGASEPSADVTVKALASNVWDQPSVNIATGETVTWDMNSGNGIPHNVQSDAGPPEDPNWAPYETTPKADGTESYMFTQPGTYAYHCIVHAGTMTGTVTVTGAPATPTPTTTSTPTRTPTSTATSVPTATATASPRPGVSATPDHTTPAPTRLAAADTTAPVVSRLRLTAVARGAKVTFALSESATVTIRLKRGNLTKRTVRLSARAGTRSVLIRGSAIVRGRYVVDIQARDARGNRAAVVRRTVRVTR